MLIDYIVWDIWKEEVGLSKLLPDIILKCNYRIKYSSIKQEGDRLILVSQINNLIPIQLGNLIVLIDQGFFNKQQIIYSADYIYGDY